MLTFDQIKELIEMVGRLRLTGIELERSGFRLTIDGYPQAETVQTVTPVLAQAPQAPAIAAPVAAAPAAAPAPAPAASAPAEAPAETPAENLHWVESPIVGTFYRSPNPEAPSFVRTGDRVEKGQVLCIVEAMKLMNEIESDIAGEIVEIKPKNAQPVEFGELLFGIRAD